MRHSAAFTVFLVAESAGSSGQNTAEADPLTALQKEKPSYTMLESYGDPPGCEDRGLAVVPKHLEHSAG